VHNICDEPSAANFPKAAARHPTFKRRADTMSESLTTKQVAEHNTVEKGLYVIVDGDVYKMDTFVEEHPGGSKILKRVGGKDASKQFWKVRCSISIGKERVSPVAPAHLT
jgi:cytochrome b involved in lipid metabolism